MASILLVRHGQASFGAADYDRLSGIGEAQSVRLGAALAANGETIDALWSGPMLRQRQTAQGVLAGLQSTLAPQWLDSLAEFDHREVILRHEPAYADHDSFVATMQSRPDAHAAFAAMFRGAMARWVGGQFDADYSESWTAFQQRAQGALQRLAQEAGGEQRHLVVTSGGVISVIVQSLLGLSTEKALDLNWRLANGGITRINVDAKGRCTLHSLNEHAHFQGKHQHHLTWR